MFQMSIFKTKPNAVAVAKALVAKRLREINRVAVSDGAIVLSAATVKFC